MANEIRIDITGDYESFRKSADKAIDELRRLAEEEKKANQAAEQHAKSSTMSWTDFRSAYLTVLDVLRVGQQIWDATVGKTLEYAEQVRQLSVISGQSATETSRMIQVLDDFGISAQSAMTATRALTKQGLTPSLETLAKLSDEYLSITDAQERNQFVLKNLGRAGLEYVQVLQKGGDALRQMGDEIDSNLILNEQQIEDARRLEIAWDGFKDTLDGLGNTLSTSIIPLAKEFVNSWTWAISMGEKWVEAWKNGTTEEINWLDVAKQTKQEIIDQENALAELDPALQAAEEGTADLADAQKEADDAVKSLTRAYQGLLSSMFSIQKQNDSYTKTIDNIVQKDADLATQKDRLTLKMWEEQRAGKLTNDEYMRYVEQFADITKAQEENAKAKEQANKDNEKAGKQRVYDLVQQKLAADGVVDSGEYEYLQNLAVTYGLVSRAAADQAISEDKRANALIASFTKVQNPMMTDLQIMQQLARYNGMVVNFGINYTSNKPANYRTPYTPVFNTPLASRMAEVKDSGGSGIAGMPYMIGTGAQPEMFIPNTNGTFVPNADKKMGSTYNIVINNPKKEAAEQSIRQALKRLSFIGVAQ